MKQTVLTFLFSLFALFAFAQIEVECLRGVEIAGDQCYFCPENGSYIFSGLKIDYNNGRALYIRRPYVARFRDADSLTVITFDRERIVSFRLSQTAYATMDTLRQIIEGCQETARPVDQGSSVTDTIVMQSSGSCNATTIFREYFPHVSNDFVKVTVNGGVLPLADEHISVYVEGIKQKQGSAGVGDYTISNDSILFNYSLLSEDVSFSMIYDTCGITVFREYFTDVTGNQVTVTAGGGTLPVLNQAVQVFVEGLRQTEGSLGDYQISGSDVNFSYPLLSEDVEVWFIMGLKDTGFLGLFRE